MGKINNELNDFLGDNQEFADLINLCLYRGEQVVLPEELEKEPQMMYPKDHRGKKHEICNDVSKRCRNGSREPWDGARSLYEMLDLTEAEKRDLSPFLQNCRLNLFNIYELKENENCRGQLKYVLRLLKLDQDKRALYAEVSENPEYKKLKLDTGNVLAALLGSEKIKKCVEEQRKKEGVTFDMCKALDDLCKDAENQGIQRGIEQGIEQGIERGIEQGIRIFILDNLEEEVPRERILLKLQRRFGMNAKDANRYYEQYTLE